METSPLPVSGCKFWSIEQWGFFRMPHLLWHGVSVYIGHLRRPVTFTPIAERLALKLSLPVWLWVGFEHPNFRMRYQLSNQQRHCCNLGGGNGIYNCMSPCPKGAKCTKFDKDLLLVLVKMLMHNGLHTTENNCRWPNRIPECLSWRKNSKSQNKYS